MGEFDEEQSDEEPEHRRPRERSARQPNTSEQSHFLHRKKLWQKEKILTDKFICQSQDLLFAGISHEVCNKKNGRPISLNSENSPKLKLNGSSGGALHQSRLSQSWSWAESVAND